MDRFSKQMIATGVAGFSAMAELLRILAIAGCVSDEDVLEIWDRALASIEALDAAGRSEILRLTRDLLEHQLVGGRNAGT